VLEFTINTKQMIVIFWTMISIVLSSAIVLNFGFPYVPYYDSWPVLVGLFFVFLLVMTLPVYIFVVILQVLSKSETS